MSQPNHDAVFNSITSDFMNDRQPDLLRRWDGHRDWWDARLAQGVDPYCKSSQSRIGTSGRIAERSGGRSFSGLNFASQDYLNLASHPAVREAACAAIETFGVHSAGSAALMGNTALSVALEARLADWLGFADCTLFPTGWAAGYGVIRTLVRPEDHVVIDVLAHASLQEGARAATRNIRSFPHLSVEAAERRLRSIRQEAPGAGILLVTETLFSMDSDVPRIDALQALCRQYGATLMVDAAHDLGAIGPEGLGFLAQQQMTGRVDVLMGSFSKSFASNGGFVASHARGLKMALRVACGPSTFSNALSPVQAAVIGRAMELIRAPEGAARRQRLLANSQRLRAGLQAAGFRVLGQDSAILPVVLGGNALSRLMTRAAFQAGAIVNLVEYPAVSRHGCRWRLQVMAEHEAAQIDRMVEIAQAARAEALKELGASPVMPVEMGDGLAEAAMA